MFPPVLHMSDKMLYNIRHNTTIDAKFVRLCNCTPIRKSHSKWQRVCS